MSQQYATHYNRKLIVFICGNYRERSAICRFAPQMATTARAEPDEIKEPEDPSGSLGCMTVKSCATHAVVTGPLVGS